MRDEAVAGIGRDVVDHADLAAARGARNQRPDAGDAELGQLLALVGRRPLDGAGRVDGGELDRVDEAVAHPIVAAGGALEERRRLRRGRPASSAGAALPPPASRALSAASRSGSSSVEVDAPGQERVGGVELARSAARAAQRRQLRVPVGGQAIERQVDAEDAVGVERAHDLEALLPVAVGAEAGALADRLGDAGLVERLRRSARTPCWW